jgi:hypothetical protein
MRYGGGFRLLGVLLVIGVVAALTAGAYSAGFVAGAGTNATNVSPWVYGGAFGASGIVGLIVTVLILVVIFRVLRFAFWSHAHGGWDRRGPGGSAPAGGHGGPWHSARRAAFDEWHRRAHEERSGQTPGGSPTGPTAS